MIIYAIDHVQLAMPAGEEEQARAFYGQILGFKEVPKPQELLKRGGVWFEQGLVNLHLGVEANFQPARKAHPAFLVDDLNMLLKRCDVAGYQIVTDQPPLVGYNRAHIFDPFGNRLEFMEKTETK